MHRKSLCLLAALGALMVASRAGASDVDAKRYVIIHADDAGMSHSVNMATIEGMEKGIVSSASIMVPCPWFKEIAAYAKGHPDRDFGIHLTLNCEWHTFRWGPVAPRESVPSLIDSEGYLWSGVADVVRSAKAADVETELRAQVKRALEFGVPVTHLDTHMGAVVSRPDLVEVYVRLGLEFNVPVFFLRSIDEAGALPKEVKDRAATLAAELDAKNLPVLDFMTQYYTGESYETKKKMYLKAIEDAKPGVRYLIIHCSVNNDELQAITSSAMIRDNDRRVFTDPGFMEAVKKSGVEVVSWSQVRELKGRKVAAAP
jgi:chitin disaccharide deacetylase